MNYLPYSTKSFSASLGVNKWSKLILTTVESLKMKRVANEALNTCSRIAARGFGSFYDSAKILVGL